jgi:hypothetical protein
MNKELLQNKKQLNRLSWNMMKSSKLSTLKGISLRIKSMNTLISIIEKLMSMRINKICSITLNGLKNKSRDSTNAKKKMNAERKRRNSMRNANLKKRRNTKSVRKKGKRVMRKEKHEMNKEE